MMKKLISFGLLSQAFVTMAMDPAIDAQKPTEERRPNFFADKADTPTRQDMGEGLVALLDNGRFTEIRVRLQSLDKQKLDGFSSVNEVAEQKLADGNTFLHKFIGKVCKEIEDVGREDVRAFLCFKEFINRKVNIDIKNKDEQTVRDLIDNAPDGRLTQYKELVKQVKIQEKVEIQDVKQIQKKPDDVSVQEPLQPPTTPKQPRKSSIVIVDQPNPNQDSIYHGMLENCFYSGEYEKTYDMIFEFPHLVKFKNHAGKTILHVFVERRKELYNDKDNRPSSEIFKKWLQLSRGQAVGVLDDVKLEPILEIMYKNHKGAVEKIAAAGGVPPTPSSAFEGVNLFAHLQTPAPTSQSTSLTLSPARRFLQGEKISKLSPQKSLHRKELDELVCQSHYERVSALISKAEVREICATINKPNNNNETFMHVLVQQIIGDLRRMGKLSDEGILLFKRIMSYDGIRLDIEDGFKKTVASIIHAAPEEIKAALNNRKEDKSSDTQPSFGAGLNLGAGAEAPQGDTGKPKAASPLRPPSPKTEPVAPPGGISAPGAEANTTAKAQKSEEPAKVAEGKKADEKVGGSVGTDTTTTHTGSGKPARLVTNRNLTLLGLGSVIAAIAGERLYNHLQKQKVHGKDKLDEQKLEGKAQVAQAA